MQLLSVGIARSIWLFDVNELNPAGKSIFPDILTWLGERYAFQTFPKSIGDLDQEKKGYIFKNGHFESGAGGIMVNFSFFGDGFVAETWASTEKTDSFLDDLLRAVAIRYGLPYTAATVRTKQYVSEINVRLDNPLENLNPRMAQFCAKLNSFSVKHHLPQFEMTGIVCAPDTSASSYKPPGLMIERKVGAPFGERRFWSKSPFTTSDHLAALEEFDNLLKKSLVIDSQ
jgi:hypothetical protein